MEFFDKKSISIIIFVILVVLGAFYLGSTWGYEQKVTDEAVEQVFGSTDISDVDLSLLLRAWNVIDDKYVFDDSPDSKTRLWGAISGLIGSIDDPYSVFLPPKEAEIFSEDISGNFGGVGMEIGIRDGILTVISPIHGTPADIAGVLAGDKIIEINGETTANLGIDEAVGLIRGKSGTQVILTLFREEDGIGDTEEVTITRAKISIPTIDTQIEDGVFIIQLFNFGGSVTRLFDNAIDEFIDSGLDKLVVDVRSNPGGFLDASIDIASYFLPQGSIIVRENFGGAEEEVPHRSKGFPKIKNNPEIIVLVNAGSASASEIFAAALQENDRATVVGNQTFGKGSVQELVPFTEDTFIKITVAKWLTPDGNSISDGGVTPDVSVDISREDIEGGIDPQLDMALSILNE